MSIKNLLLIDKKYKSGKSLLSKFVILIVLCAPVSADRLYSFGYPSDLPPFSYEESGNAMGLDVTIIKAIFNDLNLPLKLSSLPFPQLLMKIKSNTLDGVVALYAIKGTQFYKHILYSNPIYYSRISVYAVNSGSDSTIDNIVELKNKRVGYLLGYTTDLDMRMKRFAKIEAMSTPHQLITRLKNNDLDYIVLEEQLFRSVAPSLYPVGTFNAVYTEETPVAIAIAKNRNGLNGDGLYQSINESITTLKREGVIDAIIEQHRLGASLSSYSRGMGMINDVK